MIMLTMIKKLSRCAPHTIDLLEFFVHKWAPAVNDLHQPHGGVVGKFLLDVVEAIKDLPVHEVRYYNNLY